MAAGLVVDVVPDDRVGSARGGRRAHGEDQPLLERSLQQTQHLVPLRAVGQVRLSIGPPVANSRTGMLGPLYAIGKTVVYYDGPVALVAR